MTTVIRHMCALCAVAFLLCSCSKEESQLIPRDVMSDIYADMAYVDALLSFDTSTKAIADSTRVYASIILGYGYTEDDFLYSQKVYIEDAGRFIKMVKKSVKRLEAEKKDLEVRKAQRDEQTLASQSIMRFAPNRIFLLDTLNLTDTIRFDFDIQEGLDTVFRGPRMIVWADTVTVKSEPDTLSVQLPFTKLNAPMDTRRTDALRKPATPRPIIPKNAEIR